MHRWKLVVLSSICVALPLQTVFYFIFFTKSYMIVVFSHHRKKEQATTKKDRVTHCLTICENIVAQSLR